MNGTTAYALSKQYVADTADQLGSLKGAPCTIKSITEVDGGQKVTFEWIGTSGTKQTSEMIVKNGVSVTEISDKGNGTFTLLLSDGSESEPIHTVKGDPFTYSDFTAEQLESLRGEKGYSPTITENADNTDSIYKLDVTTADGTFTTPNLKGTNENGDTSNVQLDETLTDNTKAAPAGMVGEMKKEISSLSEEIANLSGGAPTPVSVVADMTDTAKIYLYTGAEDGYIAGNWYYYDGTAWVSGGKYGETNTTEATSIEPENDDIPKVFFDEAIPQTKDDVVTKFRYISKTKDFEGYAEFKAQGNSSMSYPKKNMTVKMYKDAELTEELKIDFKGWGKQRKHVYKANWIDLSHARNIVSARIWAEVVKSRSDYLELPELFRTTPNQGAVDGFPIKVYSQGIYQGRYTLNIPKDAWMSNMDDKLDNYCILCSENYASGCFRALANINGSDWTDEIHDTVPTSIKMRWNEVISFVMNSTDEEFKTNLGNYFYVDSLIDYLIFGMVSCGLDAFGKNQLFFTYDGLKWIAGMYDMDSTWGLYWNGSKFVSANYTREQYEDFVSTQSSGDGNLLYIRLAKLFYAEIQERYEELKNGALSIPNIINRFERFTDITPLDLVKEDYANTTGSGKFIGIPSQSTNNIQQIRQFVIDRYVYCDEYFASLTPIEPVPATGITLDKTALTFTDSATQTITATVEPENTTDPVVWSTDDDTIATVANGVVTPISNGSCTITATAGSVSATCDATVNIPLISTNPLYPFANGHINVMGADITITNGNHVKIETDGSSPSSNYYIRLDDFSTNTAINSAAHLNQITDVRFALKTGDIVRAIKKNTVFTATDESIGTQKVSLFTTDPIGDLYNGEYKLDAEKTITINADTDVKLIGMWMGKAQAIYELEFDFELYVNDIRYV